MVAPVVGPGRGSAPGGSSAGSRPAGPARAGSSGRASPVVLGAGGDGWGPRGRMVILLVGLSADAPGSIRPVQAAPTARLWARRRRIFEVILWWRCDYLLDSSVALKWVLPEADSTKAMRLRDEDRIGLHELLAPDIFPSEIANGLTSAERQRRIRPGESAIFLNDILSAAPALHHSSPLLIRAMEIAISTKQAVYDCIYLALAEAEGCEWVTADEQFVRGVRSSYPFLISLVSLPSCPWCQAMAGRPVQCDLLMACLGHALSTGEDSEDEGREPIILRPPVYPRQRCLARMPPKVDSLRGRRTTIEAHYCAADAISGIKSSLLRRKPPKLIVTSPPYPYAPFGGCHWPRSKRASQDLGHMRRLLRFFSA